ncbi:Gastric triacylglycerol lipase [Halotydeus destructor]|nr:Gastric triacylglycerol lipase [Halotydeus destructor]
MILLRIFTAVLVLSWASAATDPDSARTVPELISSRGYECQAHQVVTSDGYILTVHRVVNAKFSGQSVKPIILNHGLLSSAGDFLINSPGGGAGDSDEVGNNLGFELAKRGYDVWLANNRGNKYSLNHTSLTSKQRKFWDFSFDEMAEYDLPAVIDHVLNITGFETVSYVGHSQGTSIMFALLSTQPKYNKLVKPFISLAPVTTVIWATANVRLLAYEDALIKFFEIKGGPFLPDKVLSALGKVGCAAAPPVSNYICENILFFILGGWDSPQLNATRVPVYVSQDPAGTSSKNMIHWAQGIRQFTFSKFDYGLIGNLKKYGKPIPPEYDVSKITNENMAFITALNDGLADPLDVQLLRERLRVKLIHDERVPYPLFNHLDFIWGKDSGKYVNQVVLDILKKTADNQ